jgi:hypothetical protein
MTDYLKTVEELCNDLKYGSTRFSTFIDDLRSCVGKMVIEIEAGKKLALMIEGTQPYYYPVSDPGRLQPSDYVNDLNALWREHVNSHTAQYRKTMTEI